MYNNYNYFRDKGYVKINNIFSKKEISDFNKSLFNNLVTLSNTNKLSKNFKKYSEKNFQKYLDYIYKKKRLTFEKYYNFLQGHISSYKLASSKKILDTIAKLLNVKKESLLVGDLTLRIDNPGKSAAHLELHQESSYYSEVKNFNKSILVWFPLQEIKKKQGGLMILPYSQKLKNKDLDPRPDNKGRITNVKFNQEKYEKKFGSYIFTGKPGSALFSNFKTLHGSTINESNKYRISAAFRYFSCEEKNFIPFRKFRVNKNFVLRNFNIKNFGKIS